MYRYNVWFSALAIVTLAAGCHDGPLFALKAANPYFRTQWAQDEKLGLTDNTRLDAIEQLANSMSSLSEKQQSEYVDDLEALLQHDRSPQSRYLVMRAATQMRGDAGIDLLAKGLKDESSKVRIGACQGLAKRKEPRASLVLASTAGGDSESSVRLAAVESLANHQGPHVVNALRTALQTKDPAFQLAAMESLKGVTGASVGNDAEAWVAYLDKGTTGPGKPKGIQDRLKDFF